MGNHKQINYDIDNFFVEKPNQIDVEPNWIS